MAEPNLSTRALLERRTALIVIDIQASTFIDTSTDRAIPDMPGCKDRILLARQAIDSARSAGIPVIFIQEAHGHDGVDFGRELDGAEDVHCLEDNPKTALTAMEYLQTGARRSLADVQAAMMSFAA